MPPDKAVLRTIIIEGSGAVHISVPGNPPIIHASGTSVCHQVLTTAEANEVKALVERSGNRLRSWEMEGQSEEQALERTGQLNQEKIWPCVACPSCPWADSLSEISPCGRISWPAESIRTLQETSEVHRRAEAECPAPKSLFIFD